MPQALHWLRLLLFRLLGNAKCACAHLNRLPFKLFLMSQVPGASCQCHAYRLEVSSRHAMPPRAWKSGCRAWKVTCNMANVNLDLSALVPGAMESLKLNEARG